MSKTVTFKYRAFISYSHKNGEAATWLHRALEKFRIDKDLVDRKAARGPVPQSLRPIFRDRDEFVAGHTLTEQTLAALDESAALIVLCSPPAAKSDYVNEEIRLFKTHHPERPVIPLIVDGIPGDKEQECFPSALRFKLDEDGQQTDELQELLAADMREQADGKDLALAKVIAGLLGLSSDDIFRRAERDRRARQRKWIAGLGAVAVALGGLAVWAEFNRRDAAGNLAEAQVTQTLFWADLAEQMLDEGDPTTAALLSLEGLGDQANNERPFRAQPVLHLYRALGQNREMGLFKGHTDYVSQVDISPDGRTLLTVSNDGTGRLWDLETQESLATLDGHSGEVFFGSFTVDGRHVVTLSSDGSARVWSPMSGEEIVAVRVPTGDRQRLALSPDGKLFATASGDKVARVWEVETGRQVAELIGHHDPIKSLDFSPDSATLLTGSADETARIWSIETGETLITAKGHREWINSAVFDPSGSLFATASDDQDAGIWSARTGELIKHLKDSDRARRTHGQRVDQVIFSKDGSLLLTLSWDGTAKLWDVETGSLLHTFRDHEQPLIGGVIAPDGSKVLTMAGSDDTARLWSVETGQQIAALQVDGGVPVAAAFSKDGSRLVTGVFDAAYLWNLDELLDKAHARKLPHDHPVMGGALSPDGSLILTAADDGVVRIWDIEDGVLLNSVTGSDRGEAEALFDKTGERILTFKRASKTAKLWNARTGELEGEVKDYRSKRPLGELFGTLQSAAFGPMGEVLATGHSRGAIRLWNAKTLGWEKTLKGSSRSVEHLVFSPDGRFLVSVERMTPKDMEAEFDRMRRDAGLEEEDDYDVKVWDIGTGEVVARIPSGCEYINTIKFSPDGSRLLASCADLVAHIWDVQTGKERTTFEGHAPGKFHNIAIGTSYARLGIGVLDASFSPDGKLVVTAAQDRTARVWDAETGDLVGVLEGHLSNVVQAVFHQNGNLILTASEDGSAIIWDMKTLRPVAYLGPKEEGILPGATGAFFSLDGSRVVATYAQYETGSIRKSGGAAIYEIFADTPAIIAAAKKSVRRCLTPAQRKKFYMTEQPPKWCMTGPGLENVSDAAQWRPKYPYGTSGMQDLRPENNKAKADVH